MPRDCGLDPRWTFVEVAPDQGSVGPLDPSCRNGCTQPPVRQIGLGYQHQSRGIPIQPMNDAWPALRSSSEGSAAGDQRVDQSIVPVPWCRMHDETGRLVDHSQVLVLEDDLERDCRWPDGPGWFLMGQLDEDSLPAG